MTGVHMSAIHEIRYTVRPHEAGYGDTIQPVSLLNYLQDAAFEHSIKLGFSVFHLFSKGLTWVLSRYHIKIDRYPVAGESVRIHTWYPGSQKPFYLREWEILDENERIIVRATSSWLVVDIKTGKPVDGDSLLSGLTVMERRAIEDGFKPLPEPGPEGIKGRFSVRLSDTDLNRHVNHIHHILWALECVPQEFLSGNVPAEIEAAYKGEIMFGQNVIVQTRRSDDRVFNHKLVLEYDDREVARLRTRWEDKTKNPGES
jgi:acyl-ACP thioesterase